MQDKHYRELVEHWLEKEPLLLKVLCGTGHEIVENTTMFCAIRSGAGRIEINPSLTNRYQFNKYEEVVKAEMLRLLLKHPYSRRPEDCSRSECAQGSTMVLGDCYRFKHIRMNTPADYGLSSGMNYEWYARHVNENGAFMDCDKSTVGHVDGSEPGDFLSEGRLGIAGKKKRTDDIGPGIENPNLEMENEAELWDEDAQMQEVMNDLIQTSKNWGSVSGELKMKIQASIYNDVDFSHMLSVFRSSVISSGRILTRMRPNRRTGFQNMGALRKMNHRILVGLDVSGSISNDTLSKFYGVVSSIFRYDVDRIDIAKFDTKIKSVESYRTTASALDVVGRGGTSFQCIIDYALENQYDGLIIMTDGYSDSIPRYDKRAGFHMIWICDSMKSYSDNHEWMSRIGLVCPLVAL